MEGLCAAKPAVNLLLRLVNAVEKGSIARMLAESGRSAIPVNGGGCSLSHGIKSKKQMIFRLLSELLFPLMKKSNKIV